MVTVRGLTARLVFSVAAWLAATGALQAGDPWEALHREAHDVLAELSESIFRLRTPAEDTGELPPVEDSTLPNPWLIVVGFTGGIETKDSSASGVVALRDRVDEHVGGREEVLALTFNNFRWRRAASEIRHLVADIREGHAGEPPLPQPLIVAYGHSWGAGSIAKLARELRKENLEISLAIYIDAFQFRNPRLPDNIRYGINFYQRSGIFRGLPFRGKRKLIPEDPQKTQILGNYRIRPVTAHWGWNWNIIQPLLYRHHHRIGHDFRLQSYLIEIVNTNLYLLSSAMTEIAGNARDGLETRSPSTAR